MTTIGGTLDVHIYDIARIESLAGPQGTLYGASSEAGTIRIITNKPELGVTTGRVDGEINTVASRRRRRQARRHDQPSDRRPHRVPRVGILAARRRLHRQCLRSSGLTLPRTRQTSHSFDNSCCVEKNYNDLKTYGGRAALKVDLNDNWTVHSDLPLPKGRGGRVVLHGRGPARPRHGPLPARNREGQILAGGADHPGQARQFRHHLRRRLHGPEAVRDTDYTDYTDAYDAYYRRAYGGLLGYQTWEDNAGNIINPRQHITGTDHFTKQSHELRIASPADKPIRALVGAFYQRQTNHIFQNYLVDNLADDLSVTGYPGTLWLTNQKRVDKDWAMFGEANWDITPQITLTGGVRLYQFNNTLFGFAGFGLAIRAVQHRREPLPDGQRSDRPRNDPGARWRRRNGLNIPCFNVADVDVERRSCSPAKQGLRSHPSPERAMEAARRTDVLRDLVERASVRAASIGSRRRGLRA